MPRTSNTPGPRQALLQDLSTFAGGGVGETPKLQNKDLLFRSHLPIPEHRRVLDQDVLLVLGARGTGKTQLFRVLGLLDRPTQLVTTNRDARSVETSPESIAGYSGASKDYPRPEVIAAQDIKPEDASLFWAGLLVGAFFQQRPPPSSIETLGNTPWTEPLRTKLREPGSWLNGVRTDLASVHSVLDSVDEELKRRGRTIIVMYDDLDVLAANVRQAYPLIRGLLDFWLRSARRWRALRCKIFLRTDIFDSSELAFPDSSKLRPLSVALRWNADSLYRLVLKRLLNGNMAHEWRVFIGSAVPKPKLTAREEPWGIVPSTTEREHREWMKLLVGQYMGAEKRKGDTYQWFLNHLQDSRGDIAPRSFLKLFEQAAVRQLNKGLPGSDKLLLPEEVGAALGEVSKDRIKELGEEYRWIESLSKNIRGKTVPVRREEFRKWLRSPKTGEFPEHIQDDKGRVIDYLISLGILRETTDHRIHVPDIYLFGFGLKRKGGIRRPRV